MKSASIIVTVSALALLSFGMFAGAQAAPAAKHQIIDVWPGTPPGEPALAQHEGSMVIKDPRHNNNDTIVTNVSHPTLEVYLPTVKSNGAAIIVAPGGGFHVLAYGVEGMGIAERLAAHGYTAFILKYRLNPMPDDPKILGPLLATMGGAGAPQKEGATPAPMPKLVMGPHERDAIADGNQAIKLVRSLAPKYGFDPQRVGIIGFSAGGMVSGSQAVNPTPAERPNFVGIIYSNVPGDIPVGAPPAFMAAAADDPLSNAMPDLFTRWRKAGSIAELHIYAKGQHGFGSATQGLPVDHWMDALFAWIEQQGFAKPAKK